MTKNNTLIQHFQTDPVSPPTPSTRIQNGRRSVSKKKGRRSNKNGNENSLMQEAKALSRGTKRSHYCTLISTEDAIIIQRVNHPIKLHSQIENFTEPFSSVLSSVISLACSQATLASVKQWGGRRCSGRGPRSRPPRRRARGHPHPGAASGEWRRAMACAPGRSADL
jgi:hypothetical protein